MTNTLRSEYLLALCLFAVAARPAVAQEAGGASSLAHSDPITADTMGPEVTAQAVEQSTQTATPAQSDTQPPGKNEKKAKTKRGALVIAPIPISSPAIGSGLVLAVGYIFPLNKTDKASPPSIIGAAGLYTNNETRGFAIVGQFYLKQNTYKITTGFGRGNVNYDLYGSREFAGLKLPLQQTGHVFRGEFLRRVGWQFFLGPRFSTGESTLTIRPSGGDTPPPPPDLGLHTTLTAVGATLTRDTSLNRFYPTGGMYFKFTSDFYSQTLGSKYSFQSYVTNFSKYWGLGENQVLAYNGYFCATGGHPPFFGNCVYGTSNQLRGYVAGKYFDRYIVATQLEYRLALPWRLGVVAFGGVGEAIPGGDQLLFTNNNFLPGGGGGVRFQLSKQYHVNLRADIARGKDGHTFSLGLGEAF